MINSYKLTGLPKIPLKRTRKHLVKRTKPRFSHLNAQRHTASPSN